VEKPSPVLDLSSSGQVKNRSGPVKPANVSDVKFLDTTRINKNAFVADVIVLDTCNSGVVDINTPKNSVKKIKIESPLKSLPYNNGEIFNNLGQIDCIVNPIKDSKSDFSMPSVCKKGSEMINLIGNFKEGQSTENVGNPLVSIESSTSPLPLPDQLFAFHKDNLIYALNRMKSDEVLPWLIDSIFPLCSPVLSRDSGIIEGALQKSIDASTSKEVSYAENTVDGHKVDK
jgi:hypothetical protein